MSRRPRTRLAPAQRATARPGRSPGRRRDRTGRPAWAPGCRVPKGRPSTTAHARGRRSVAAGSARHASWPAAEWSRTQPAIARGSSARVTRVRDDHACDRLGWPRRRRSGGCAGRCGRWSRWPTTWVTLSDKELRDRLLALADRARLVQRPVAMNTRKAAQAVAFLDYAYRAGDRLADLFEVVLARWRRALSGGPRVAVPGSA